MLTINTVRYGTDEFTLAKSCLLYRNTPLDCTAMTQVLGLTITGTQPSGTDRRLAFKVNGVWYKLTIVSGTAALTALPTQTLTESSLLAEGNTVDEVSSATSIPDFVGKYVTPAMALYAPADATVYPTIKINSLSGKSNQNTYVYVEYSAEHLLTASGNAGMVTDIALSTTATNGGSVTVDASLNQNGVWSDYMPLMSAKYQSGTSIKFRATYTAPNVGVSTAKVNSLLVTAKENGSVVVGTTANIYTKTQDFGTGMLYARLLVKHQLLTDARLKAYVSFCDSLSKREKHGIGTGTGTLQTIILSDPNVDLANLNLFANLSPIYGFDFNTATNSITFTAAAGTSISATYSYGGTSEDWQEMQVGSTQKYQDGVLYSADFTYEVTAGTEKGVSAILVTLEKPPGSVSSQQFGVGSGAQQQFVLDHYARADTISITASDNPLARSNWSYEPSSKILTLVAPVDAPLKYSYLWDAEVPVVRGIVAAWNE